MADNRTTKDQLRELGQLFGEHFNDELLIKNGFNEWLDVFIYLKKDEFLPYFTLVGGMPAYLLELNPNDLVETNLKIKVLDKKEFLHNEVEFILREELREPRIYLSIRRSTRSN